MKRVNLAALFFIITLMAVSQNLKTIDIWPGGVPESNGITEKEIIENERISNVSVPQMTMYAPVNGKNTGVAILVCPGGGYIRQAAGHEGSQFGKWLSENGITAFVLKYRLPNGHAFIPSKDASQAINIIRKNAAEWGINPSKIGISGFSAGGHLASTAGTIFTASTRPDFMILFYPVITMKESVTHAGSRENLLGKNYSKDSLEYYSTENRVTANTPPALIFLSDDDKAVVPENSIAFYRALKSNGVKASMHIFPEGGHGWGYRETFRYHNVWKGLYMDWLKQIKILD